jgi:hypothetical protein
MSVTLSAVMTQKSCSLARCLQWKGDQPHTTGATTTSQSTHPTCWLALTKHSASTLSHWLVLDLPVGKHSRAHHLRWVAELRVSSSLMIRSGAGWWQGALTGAAKQQDQNTKTPLHLTAHVLHVSSESYRLVDCLQIGLDCTCQVTRALQQPPDRRCSQPTAQSATVDLAGCATRQGVSREPGPALWLWFVVACALHSKALTCMTTCPSQVA